MDQYKVSFSMGRGPDNFIGSSNSINECYDMINKVKKHFGDVKCKILNLRNNKEIDYE